MGCGSSKSTDTKASTQSPENKSEKKDNKGKTNQGKQPYQVKLDYVGGYSYQKDYGKISKIDTAFSTGAYQNVGLHTEGAQKNTLDVRSRQDLIRKKLNLSADVKTK